MESTTWRCPRWFTPRDAIGGRVRHLASDEVLVGPGTATSSKTFGDQEAVGGDDQRCMMVERPPAAAFAVSETKFRLQFLVVALGAPAHVRLCNQVVCPGVRRQGRQEAAQRFGIAGRPFGQQPLFGTQTATTNVAAGAAQADGSDMAAQSLVHALAPTHDLPCLLPQLPGLRVHAYRLLAGRALRPQEQTALATETLCQQRLDSLKSDHQPGVDAIQIGQTQFAQATLKSRVCTLFASIRQDAVHGLASGHQRLQLRQRDLGRGGEADLGGDADLALAPGIIRPLVRQVRVPGHRHARLLLRRRVAHRNLMAVLLAQYAAAIRPRHAHRLPALNWKLRVVDGPESACRAVLRRCRTLAVRRSISAPDHSSGATK